MILYEILNSIYVLSIAKDFIIICFLTWYSKNFIKDRFKAARQYNVQQIGPMSKNGTAKTCDTYWKFSLDNSMHVHHKIYWPRYYTLNLWQSKLKIWHFWCSAPYTACTRNIMTVLFFRWLEWIPVQLDYMFVKDFRPDHLFIFHHVAK